MSTIAIGDIHGNLAALDDLLNRITMEISADDTVVFLGDYIDRGPDARGCIQRIIDFRRAGKGRVVTLLGNHDEWLLRTHEDYTRHSWLLGMEGFQTVESYSASAASRLREEAENKEPPLLKDSLRDRKQEAPKNISVRIHFRLRRSRYRWFEEGDIRLKSHDWGNPLSLSHCVQTWRRRDG